MAIQLSGRSGDIVDSQVDLKSFLELAVHKKEIAELTACAASLPISFSVSPPRVLGMSSPPPISDLGLGPLICTQEHIIQYNIKCFSMARKVLKTYIESAQENT